MYKANICYKGSYSMSRCIITAKQIPDFKGLVPIFFKKKKKKKKNGNDLNFYIKLT
ncbi:rCG44546 [Rattus norvegicus]|uniref:RCG44546 n=1 Tax=Rattus norvegicus TaxID=10116 RepID=A6I4Y4_RAT|nr:rCG44546 [Rattus norvegicus]